MLDVFIPVVNVGLFPNGTEVNLTLYPRDTEIHLNMYAIGTLNPEDFFPNPALKKK